MGCGSSTAAAPATNTEAASSSSSSNSTKQAAPTQEPAKITAPSSSHANHTPRTNANDSSADAQDDTVRISTATFAKQNHEKFISVYSVKKGGNLLGSGSFASVFLATHKTSGIQRAVKACALLEAGEEKMLRHEVDIMRELSHPNVITVVEYFVEKNKWLFVLELCEGGELFDRIVKQKHFTEIESVEILRQILRAVAYCHSLGIAHRDIKPENLLYDSPDPHARLRLSDFGYACKVKPGDVLEEQCGSPYYVAPEVLKGKYNEVCDIWSVGVVMYILMVGHVPFDGRDNNEILSKIESCTKVPFKDSEWASVAPAAKELCAQLLDVNPAKRPSALQALQHPWMSKEVQRSKDPLPVAVVERMMKFREQQLLQRAVKTFVSINVMSGQKKEELAKAFTALDKDGDGTLDVQEIIAGFASSFGGDKEKLADKFAALDCNRDGRIDYGEFVVAMMDEETALAEKNLRAAFRAFDADGNGVITAPELRQALGNQNLNVGGESVWQSMIASVDSNGDGVIDFEEFKRMMRGVITDVPEGVAEEDEVNTKATVQVEDGKE